MNLEHVNQAIAIMERVKARNDSLNMCAWQDPKDYERGYMYEEQELHTCGSSACFAGWVAVSPEWKEFGGTIGRNGIPDIANDDDEELEGDDAMAYWLGIEEEDASNLCGLFLDDPNKCMADIEVDDVLAALYRLRDTGSVYLPDGTIYPNEATQ